MYKTAAVEAAASGLLSAATLLVIKPVRMLACAVLLLPGVPFSLNVLANNSTKLDSTTTDRIEVQDTRHL